MSKKYRSEAKGNFEKKEIKEKYTGRALIGCFDGTLYNNDGSIKMSDTLNTVGQFFDDLRGLTVEIKEKICVRISKPLCSEDAMQVLPHIMYIPGVGADSNETHTRPGLLTFYGKDKEQAKKTAKEVGVKSAFGYDFFGIGERFPKVDGITGKVLGVGYGQGREENAYKILSLFYNQKDKYDIYSLLKDKEEKLPAIEQITKQYSDSIPLIIQHGEDIWVVWRNLFGELQLSQTQHPELYEHIFSGPRYSEEAGDNLIASSSQLKPAKQPHPEKIAHPDNDESIYADLAEIQGPAVNAYGEYSKVVLIGWSRGAVTAIDTANHLARIGFRGEIHLFLIDPVAGGDEGLIDEMIRTLPSNVKATIILAKGEQRDKFEAQDLSRMTPEKGAEITYLPVNGTHFQVADYLRDDGEFSSIPAEITRYHLEQLVINAVGEEQASIILPKRRADFTHKELISKYAATQVNIEDYEHNLDSQIIERRMFNKVRRNCLDNLEDYTHKPEIFVNAHHAEIFAHKYSNLYEKIINDTVSLQDLDIDAPDLDNRSKEIIISSILLTKLNKQIAQMHLIIRHEEAALQEFAKKSTSIDAKGDESPKPSPVVIKNRMAANEALKAFKVSLLELRSSAEQEIYKKLAEIRANSEESGAIDDKINDAALAKLVQLPLVRQCSDAAKMSKIVLAKAKQSITITQKFQAVNEFSNRWRESWVVTAKRIATSAAGYLRVICLAPILALPAIYYFVTKKVFNIALKKPAVKKIEKPAQAAENFLYALPRKQSNVPSKSVRPIIRPR